MLPLLAIARDDSRGLLHTTTADGAIDSRWSTDDKPWEAVAFNDSDEFGDYFMASSHAYGPTSQAGTYHVVQIEHLTPSSFTHCAQQGYLRIPGGNWPLDGVYRAKTFAADGT